MYEQNLRPYIAFGYSNEYTLWNMGCEFLRQQKIRDPENTNYQTCLKPQGVLGSNKSCSEFLKVVLIQAMNVAQNAYKLFQWFF